MIELVDKDVNENSHYKHSSHVLEGRLHEHDEENETCKKDSN